MKILQRGGSTGGPETITIKEYPEGGQYMVYVHQYSTSGSMCTSRARITIYPGNGATSQSVEIPSDCNQRRYWFVGCFSSGVRLNGFEAKNVLLRSAPTLASCD